MIGASGSDTSQLPPPHPSFSLDIVPDGTDLVPIEEFRRIKDTQLCQVSRHPPTARQQAEPQEETPQSLGFDRFGRRGRAQELTL